MTRTTTSLLLASMMVFGCGSDKASDGQPIVSDFPAIYSDNLISRADSIIIIDGKKYKTIIKYWDITEQSRQPADSLAIPVFSSTIQILNQESQQVLRDSLLNDSWGYPGKILSIKSYQIGMPMMVTEGQYIIFTCVVFCEDGDQITGQVKFDTSTGETEYKWEESYED